ncbi:MAG TPA: OmcA/MtrC family decaheme c-type cytochrome [Candidatus Acidoferrales bacterium]|nr:OmcA/MtrC family decaheme c-type cytochrome [Candidatus Acidoferrales bacterium]
MRISSSVSTVGRYALVLAVAAGSLVLMSAPKKTGFTVHDKAYFADANTVNFVRPGLVIKIVSANIATDGTISVDYKVTDPQGLGLDINGITTPGAISPRYVIAYMPSGQTQFVTYFTRISTDATTKNTATQPTGDSGGTLKNIADGEYVYTFAGKAPANWDKTLTHRLGVYGSRNLTEFDLGTDYADNTLTWVPAGGTPAPRDVIRTTSCNKCHDQLAAHGGSRRSVELCIMCHQPQNSDPNGNSADFKVMIHKIHEGSTLPSVVAGTPYVIGSVDASLVVFPSSASQTMANEKTPVNMPRCNACHDAQAISGAVQADNWMTNPNRAACGSCHDNVNFATGANHQNLPQVNDGQCSGCHIPQGELEFDASIKGAHTIMTESSAFIGLVFTIVKVENGVAGKTPTVTFTAKDAKGNPVTMAQLTGGSNRLALVMAGPASDYGYTSFGSDVITPGYVSENPVPTAKCDGSGTCTYTFTHAIPATATGTYSIGVEGRLGFTILPNTTLSATSEAGGNNVVTYFPVDGSKVAPRRTVVDIAKCNSCHVRLSVHGENRNQIQQCVMCHNPSENDSSVRPNAVVAADKALPPQSINFARMIHEIHTGDNGNGFTIVGFGGSHNDFSDVAYPVMSPNGITGDTAKCDMCHVNSSETVFPIGKNAVLDTQGLLSPVAATTSACTACHQDKSTLAHALSQTDPKFGESCDVCHAAGAAFDVQQVHAGK